MTNHVVCLRQNASTKADFLAIEISSISWYTNKNMVLFVLR